MIRTHLYLTNYIIPIMKSLKLIIFHLIINNIIEMIHIYYLPKKFSLALLIFV